MPGLRWKKNPAMIRAENTEKKSSKLSTSQIAVKIWPYVNFARNEQSVLS